jgi:hypothetical protein
MGVLPSSRASKCANAVHVKSASAVSIAGPKSRHCFGSRWGLGALGAAAGLYGRRARRTARVNERAFIAE